MSYCHVANQISKHCNEEEAYCSECGSTMTLGDTARAATMLFCDSCDNEIDLDESSY